MFPYGRVCSTDDDKVASESRWSCSRRPVVEATRRWDAAETTVKTARRWRSAGTCHGCSDARCIDRCAQCPD